MSGLFGTVLCSHPNSHLALLQIRDLNAGTFGFVELALDKSTGQQVAIKFIERGDKVCIVKWLLLNSCRASSSYAYLVQSPVSCFINSQQSTGHCSVTAAQLHAAAHSRHICPMQITKYVEREIMNHRSLMHPHIVQFKEVSGFAA